MNTRDFLLKGLLAGLVVLGIVAGTIALGQWLVGSDDEPGAGSGVDGGVPATAQALAAVTVEVLGIEPTSYELPDDDEELGAALRLDPDGDGWGDYLRVSVRGAGEGDGGDDPDESSPCAENYECADWSDHGGRFHLSWQEEEPEEDPGIVYLSFRVGDEVRGVVYAGETINGDPREEDLPFSVEGDLVRLLADERFSRTTTRELVETELPGWPEGDS